jgi:hypothetical protein
MNLKLNPVTDIDAIRQHLDSEGRLIAWPSKRSLQRIALDYLASKFEVGHVYTEKEVNALLNQHHTFGDAALLRRELFELGKLNRERDGSAYWATPNTKLL